MLIIKCIWFLIFAAVFHPLLDNTFDKYMGCFKVASTNNHTFQLSQTNTPYSCISGCLHSE